MSEALRMNFEKSLTVWKNSLKDPSGYQEALLKNLLTEYEKTEYGERLCAKEIQNVEQYRNHFPTLKYEDLKPFINQVLEGDYRAFLSEKPLRWVITRGSTGKPKLFPITKRHLNEIFQCGSRAIINYYLRTGDIELFKGAALNLTLPSNVGKLLSHESSDNYGYSSGVYAQTNPQLESLRLVPSQEEIDALGTGLSSKEWQSRFELTYQRSKDKNVSCIIGVAPVQVSFARHLKRKHGLYPKDVWRAKAIFSTSVAKIQTRYAPLLKAFYGNVPVIEMYTATEGAFAQQMDKFPYVVPNYDTYFFEVNKGSKFKMLYELERGEWGRLVVSTSMLPRYDIGDYIEAMGKNYFRVFGRAKRTVLIEHLIYRALFKWFL